ncbi:hypothetical protein [Pelotomaculum propionicicum]|uniref:Vitamin K epoxide reductase domain-containing protein n=1 Tax=Pelotomaculum propionicicum TaxID=258475 RepID=A0A4Y7RRB8_9FIRM|nr:hypothetical protein [Pelotomaculum propionicicum]NLI11806.1 hypothetical protein [Peptococcaceae bacterium]TEB11316.1 hypothetical protein Pmgp_01679 [Pelotomaculum propionicicum]
MVIKEFLREIITKGYFNKTVLLFSLLNALLLCYLGWEKNTGCSLCHRVPFLPVTDVTLAVTGVIASLALAIMIVFANRVKLLNCAAFLLAFITASFSFFLLTSQVLINKALCYPCLLSSIIFYIIFFVLFYDLVIKSVWSKHLSR